MMTYKKIYLAELGVTIEAAMYLPETGVAEWHLILHVEPRKELFQGQLERIYAAEDLLLTMPEFKGAQYVTKRYFLSDSTNQQPLMRKETNVSISIIQQQPLDGSKIAAWLYLERGVEIKNQQDVIVVDHNGYRHLWKMSLTSPQGDSASQTTQILNQYEEILQRFGATLADNCIRTWFFVRDVDTQYAGMVTARRQNFIEQGLTEKTHYISSTGIGGGPAEPKALIQMGTYALVGFDPHQQHYLYASSHLNPTYEYGVTFERGTVMEYGDRAHVFISGTASINNKGEVMYVGDIVRQTKRMWENVETLLAEGGTTFDDVMQIVVYLRDAADYEMVREMFAERYPNIPTLIALAPVCRPTWLIEIECIAVQPRKNPKYRDF